MSAIELVAYLTALSVFGPGLIYMLMPRNTVMSVAQMKAST